MDAAATMDVVRSMMIGTVLSTMFTSFSDEDAFGSERVDPDGSEVGNGLGAQVVDVHEILYENDQAAPIAMPRLVHVQVGVPLDPAAWIGLETKLLG